MSSSGTPLFGNFSSQPNKTPKSPKGTMIENPYTKNAQYGALTLTNQQSSSLALRSMPRSPLTAMTPNRDNLRQQKVKPMATPGPPPKMSLSLMGGLTTPMQVSGVCFETRCSGEGTMKVFGTIW